MDESLFEDKPFEAGTPDKVEAKQEASKDDHLFEDVEHPDSKKSDQDISASRAALVGAGQGASLGWGNKLVAPIMAAAEMKDAPMLANEKPDSNSLKDRLYAQLSKFQRLKDQARQTMEQEQSSAKEQHPISYGAGALAGGILPASLLPITKYGQVVKGAAQGAADAAGGGVMGTLASTGVKAAGGAGIGAGLGAVQGAGEAEPGDELEGAESGAKTGAEVGAILPVAGQVGAILPVAGQAAASTGGLIKSGVKAAGSIPLVSDTVQNFQRGLQGQNLITSAGRRAISQGVRDTAGDLLEQLQGLKKNVGQKIGSSIDASSDAGNTVDLSDSVKNTLTKLDEQSKTDTTGYAAGLKRQIQTILGIKPEEQVDSLYGVDRDKLPEGLSLPAKTESTDKIEVTPSKAQELKLLLDKFAPKAGMDPLRVPTAEVANSLKNDVAGQIEENVPELGGEEGLNAQYGAMKDALKRLSVNSKQLPEQTQAKIFSTLSQMENENLSGDQARAQIQDVLANVRQVDPEMADQFESQIKDAVKPLQLANKNIGGSNAQGILGVPRSIVTSGSNAAGLAANKLGVNSVMNGVSNAAEAASNAIPPKVKTFAQNILNAPKTQASGVIGSVDNQGAAPKVASTVPYKAQRQVADATSTADPEVLTSQAKQIRDQYGQQGEQLAQTLENMALEKPDKRQSLMFMVMQNPANRKMMGLGVKND